MPLDFGLLNQSTPERMFGSVQSGMDNALLRQSKIDAAQREQDAARMAMQEFAMKRQAYMDKMQEQDRQRKQLELFRKTLQAPQYAGMQPAPIGQEQAQMMQPEVSAFGPQGIVDAASYADKPIYQPNPDMAQLAQAPDAMLAKGMGDYYDALFKHKFGKDAKKYEKLGKDDVLIDLETRQQIAAGPKGDSELKPTGDYANFLLMQKNGMVPANMDYTQWHRDNSRAGASTTKLSVNTMGDASKEAQKEFIKTTGETWKNLSVAPTALENITRAKELVAKAGGFVGSFGPTKMEIAKFFNNNLGTNINPAGIKSAEELRSRLFMQIMDNLKKMDAQPSQQQQQVMQDALGNLGTDPGAIGAVLDAFGDVIKGKVSVHNTAVKDAESRGVKFPFNPIIQIGDTQSPSASFYNLPMPKLYKGRTITDSVTGIKYHSDGNHWVKVK